MRIRIDFPEPPVFSTEIPVLIQHINYGGHLGNDSILSILHEVRLRWLAQWQRMERDEHGTGLIMADSAIQYQGEAFYGESLQAELAVSIPGRASMDIYYRLTATRNGHLHPVALAKTGMVCFNYQTRQVIPWPENWLRDWNTL